MEIFKLSVKHFLVILFLIINIPQSNAQGKSTRVTLDYFFNNEWRKNPEGKPERFHYVWEETDQLGFSTFGKIFTDFGAKLNSIEVAPTKKNLKGTDIYIIVDPDNADDNPNPNTISYSHISAIKDWVHRGGVLVLMGNDSINCDLIHLNNLANNFGINFSNRSRNLVKENDFEIGAVLISENEVFKKTKKAYLKEISILDVKPPAKILISMGNDAIIAVSKYGKGTIFAVGDPWMYNEYVNGRNIPPEFENLLAGKELVKWLIDQTKK